MSDDSASPTTRTTMAARLGVLTIAAVLFDLGTMHVWHQADSLLPSLVSTLHWTFYYWEQNRYGMLTALLARPFTEPFTNLLVQNGMTIWAGLATFPLAATYFGVKRPWLGGLVAAALYVLITPEMTQWTYLSTFNVFSVSLAFGLAGLIVVNDRRRSRVVRIGAATLCFLLGSWVNSALGLMLAPLAVLVPLSRKLCGDLRNPDAAGMKSWSWLIRDPALRSVTFGLGLCGFGTVAAMMMQRTTPYRTTWVVLPPSAEWAGQFEHAWVTILHESKPEIGWAVLYGIVLFAVTHGLFAWNSLGKSEARRAVVLPLFVFLGCAAYVSVMMILFAGRWRYAAPAMMLFHAALISAFVGSLVSGWSDRRTRCAEWAATLLLGIAIVIAWGWPSAERAKQLVILRNGLGVEALVDSKATHITGDYWKVWPAVFCVNQAYAERGSEERLWGVTYRSFPTFDQWTAIPPPQRRIAAFTGDDAAQKYRDWFAESLKRIDKHGRIEIWVTD